MLLITVKNVYLLFYLIHYDMQYVFIFTAVMVYLSILIYLHNFSIKRIILCMYMYINNRGKIIERHQKAKRPPCHVLWQCLFHVSVYFYLYNILTDLNRNIFRLRGNLLSHTMRYIWIKLQVYHCLSLNI